jgi:hypothetical protein
MRTFEVLRPGIADALVQSDVINARVLAANTVETFQAPAGARIVVFSADGNFYCKIAPTSTPAAIPAADVTDGSASELNPNVRYLPSEQAFISLIASATRVVTMQFFAV